MFYHSIVCAIKERGMQKDAGKQNVIYITSLICGTSTKCTPVLWIGNNAH